MEEAQKRLMELLREVHALAAKEIERLNLRVIELESASSTPQPVVGKSPAMKPTIAEATIQPVQACLLNEKQVADYLSLSVASLRRWRLFRTGPKFVKIGSLVRYRRGDLDDWLKSQTRTSSRHPTL
jgi:predicted DNA-binding transcriptional regulator AlpA